MLAGGDVPLVAAPVISVEHPYAERLKQRLKLPEDLVPSLSEDVGKHGAGLAVDGQRWQPLFPAKLNISSSSAASTCSHRTISASSAPAPAIYQRLTWLVVFSVFLNVADFLLRHLQHPCGVADPGRVGCHVYYLLVYARFPAVVRVLQYEGLPGARRHWFIPTLGVV